jgi:hypothetical protein
MTLGHGRQRRDVALLAAGALSGDERASALRHLEGCAACRAEHDALLAFLRGLEADPLRAEVKTASADVSLPVLVDQVNRRIDQALRNPRPSPSRRWSLALPALASALALVAIVGGPLVARWKAGSGTTPPSASPEALAPEATAPEVSADALLRLERNVTREQAARYLGDAQDVLATLSAAPHDCEKGQVDVVAEAKRSRELLARSTFLGIDEDAVASARPVLDDVEQLLREVASFDDCARPKDVERLQEEIARRQLLMKMRLMQRELLG